MSLSPQNQYVRLALYGLEDVAAEPPDGVLLELQAETSANAMAVIAASVDPRRTGRRLFPAPLRLSLMNALLSHQVRCLLLAC
jgi:hypothetical protein